MRDTILQKDPMDMTQQEILDEYGRVEDILIAKLPVDDAELVHYLGVLLDWMRIDDE